MNILLPLSLNIGTGGIYRLESVLEVDLKPVYPHPLQEGVVDRESVEGQDQLESLV